jgi:hypothetical protein
MQWECSRHLGLPGVKVITGLNPSILTRWDEADVGDTTNILARTKFSWVVKEQCIEEGDEWCACIP